MKGVERRHCMGRKHEVSAAIDQLELLRAIR